MHNCRTGQNHIARRFVSVFDTSHAASTRTPSFRTAAGSKASSNGASRPGRAAGKGVSYGQGRRNSRGDGDARRPLGVIRTRRAARTSQADRPSHCARCWKAKACCNGSRAVAASCQARAWYSSGSASLPLPWCGRPVTQFSEALSTGDRRDLQFRRDERKPCALSRSRGIGLALRLAF